MQQVNIDLPERYRAYEDEYGYGIEWFHEEIGWVICRRYIKTTEEIRDIVKWIIEMEILNKYIHPYRINMGLDGSYKLTKFDKQGDITLERSYIPFLYDAFRIYRDLD